MIKDRKFIIVVEPIDPLVRFRNYHPTARVDWVTRNGRTVWMTRKMMRLLALCDRYWTRGQRTTMARLAAEARCSRSYVSRVLRRFDLWRFFNVTTFRGRNGGTYVTTIKGRAMDWAMRHAGARVTMATRRLANIKAQAAMKAAAWYRKTHPFTGPVQLQFRMPAHRRKVGNTDATFSVRR